MLWANPQQAFLRARANSIEGGTTEIMKNILGERVLGLPGDVRVDKELPWSQGPPLLTLAKWGPHSYGAMSPSSLRERADVAVLVDRAQLTLSGARGHAPVRSPA